mgnify:CR=1 FL=1
MSHALREVETSARKLSRVDRASLVRVLVRDLDRESQLEDEIALAWAHEADKRADQLDRGEVEGLDLEEVLRRARTHLSKPPSLDLTSTPPRP